MFLVFLGYFDVKSKINMSLLYPEESYKITGAIYEVHKELGPGLNEKIYQEGLQLELLERNIPFQKELT